MKKVAILLDGGFVLMRLYVLMGRRHPTARDVLGFAHACVAADEEAFRIYYYDCPPYEKTLRNPLDPANPVDFSQSRTAQRNAQLQHDLAGLNLVAFRRGELGYEGWGISRNSERRLLDTPDAPDPITAADLTPRFRQKTVDMKIGLDVAWLSSKNIVDRIILVTGDLDFVPAMKFARREGTQVVLVTMGSALVKRALKEHSDYVRDVPYPAGLPSPAGP